MPCYTCHRYYYYHHQHLIAPWYFSTCDPGREIGSLAQAALNIAFPPKKYREVLTYFSDNILRYLMENINNATPESLSDASMCSTTEAEDRYERVMAGTYAALAQFLCWLFPTPLPEGAPMARGTQPLPLPAATQQLLTDMVNISFFKKTTSKRVCVRHGALAVLAVVCAQCPQILLPTPSLTDSDTTTPLTKTASDTTTAESTSSHPKKFKQSPLSRLSMIVSNAFVNEKEANNIPNTFRAFVAFIKTYPSAWIHLDFTLIVKRLIDLLTRKEKESATVELTISYVLPILAAVPLSVIRAQHESALVLFETLSSLTILPRFLKGQLKPNIALIELCTYFIIQFSKEAKSEHDDENGCDAFHSLFMPKLIDISISLAVKEWKRARSIDDSSQTESALVPLLRALHKAASPALEQIDTQYSHVNQFWKSFSSRLTDELSTMAQQAIRTETGSVAAGGVNNSEEDQTHDDVAVTFETNILFIDNVFNSAVNGLKSVPTHNSSTDFGLNFFLKTLFEHTELQLLQEKQMEECNNWSSFVWIYLTLQIAPCLLEKMSSDQLLNVLTSKSWMHSALECMKSVCGSARNGLDVNHKKSSFILKLLKSTFAMIVTCCEDKEDAVSFHYRGIVLESCMESGSLLGICIAIDSELLCDELVAVAFQDDKHTLYAIGLFLQKCVTALCSPSAILHDSDVTEGFIRTEILPIDPFSQIQFLVQCQNKPFLNSLTTADILLERYLQVNLREILSVSDDNQNPSITVCHWTFLTLCCHRLGNSEGALSVKEQQMLSLIMTLIFLNREAVLLLLPMKGNVWQVITSWQQVQDTLLHLCSSSLVESFTGQIVNYLNARLFSGMEGLDFQCGAGSKPTLDSLLLKGQVLPEFMNVKDTSPTTTHTTTAVISSLLNITAEVWSTHAHNCLLISRQHPKVVPFEKIVKQLGMRSTKMWTALLDRLLLTNSVDSFHIETVERLCFVIRCVFHLDTLWGGEAGHTSIIAQLLPVTADVSLAVSILQTLVLGRYTFCQLVGKGSCVLPPSMVREDITDLLECCQLLIASFVKNSTSEQLCFFTNELFILMWNLTKTTTKNSMTFLSQYGLLEAVNMISQAATVPCKAKDVENRHGRRLSLETPLFADMIPRYTPVCYVSIDKEDRHEGDVHLTMRATLATVVSTHRDDGPNKPTFYTLLMSAEDRELQTESKRYATP